MHKIARIVPLLAALALAHPLSAQQPLKPLRAAEIRAAAAPDAYALLESLRHDWLWAAGDPATPEAQTRTLVFIDGRFVGDLRLLHGLSTDHIAGVRHMGGREFLQSSVYTPHNDVASVFFLTSRRAAGAAMDDGSRLMITLGAGPAIGDVAALREHLVQTGYDRPVPGGQDSHALGTEGRVPTVVATMRYLVRPWLSVEAGVQSGSATLAAGSDGVRGAVVNRSIATEWFGLVDVGNEVVRLGVGPSLRRTAWVWGRSFCGCDEVERTVSMDPGVAADLAVTMPARSRAFVELRGHGRWYGTTHTPEYTHRGGGAQDYTVPPMEREAFTLSASLLLGVRL